MAAFSRGRCLCLLASSSSSISSQLPRPFVRYLTPQPQTRLFATTSIRFESVNQRAQRMVEELKAQRAKQQAAERAARQAKQTGAAVESSTEPTPSTQIPVTVEQDVVSEERLITVSKPITRIEKKPLPSKPIRSSAYTLNYNQARSNPNISKQIYEKLASGEKFTLYEAPPTAGPKLTFMATFVSGLFLFMLYNLIAFIWTIEEIGLASRWIMALTYAVTGGVMVLGTWAGYSVRAKLVQKITLSSVKTRTGPIIKAKVQAKGWMPYAVTTEEVPVSRLRVNLNWTEIEQPKLERALSMGEVATFLKPIYWLRYQLRDMFYMLRFKLSRDLMLRLWTEGRVGSPWSSYLLDADGLISPKSQTHAKMYNNADVFYRFVGIRGEKGPAA